MFLILLRNFFRAIWIAFCNPVTIATIISIGNQQDVLFHIFYRLELPPKREFRLNTERYTNIPVLIGHNFRIDVMYFAPYFDRCMYHLTFNLLRNEQHLLRRIITLASNVPLIGQAKPTSTATIVLTSASASMQMWLTPTKTTPSSSSANAMRVCSPCPLMTIRDGHAV